jgi:hypothetical protein
MQEKQTARVFVEIFLIILMLGILSAAALPLIGNMGGNSGDASREVGPGASTQRKGKCCAMARRG